MHPRRLEFLERAFQEPVDAVLHTVIMKREEEFDGWPAESYSFYTDCCFLEDDRCYIEIDGRRRLYGAGHISVRFSIIDEVLFSVSKSTIGYEDTLYLLNLHTLGFRIGFIDTQLSLYMQFLPEVRLQKDSVLCKLSL